MSYEIVPLRKFLRQAKKLIKHYPSLRKEIVELIKQLKENPE